MKIVALLFALTALGDGRAQIHAACFTCEVRCKQRGGDVKACTQTCLEIKRSSCQSRGFGPGPKNTCDCT